jgi:hypothetical protein
MDKKTIEILNFLKSKSVFETSDNGNKGHVIWSSEFHKLSQELVKLFAIPCVSFFLKIPPPNLKQKNIKEKSNMAKELRNKGYSIREIMTIMGYKSPRSIQLLLKKEL